MTNPLSWFFFCGQILKAMEYLVKIIHNDIKCDNILISHQAVPEVSLPDSVQSILPSTSGNWAPDQHIVVIDFGKATIIQSAKKYSLNEKEIQSYFQNYRHIAPEVVRGECQQSPHSDMFSVGCLFQSLVDHSCFTKLPCKDMQILAQLVDQLTNISWQKRPSASKSWQMMDKMFL